ncbi:histidine kinase [Spirosoma sp. SC4-14]|uniref:sensor histidine kinase n=1 Tax=Spirosoma sp. SC4-14 TaxID=3128900 RepID=UPI0030D1DFAE
MKPLNDTKLRIFGPLALFVFGTLFFRLNWYFELPISDLVKSDLIAITAGFTCWQVARWAIRALQYRYPELAQTTTRFVWLLVLAPLLVNFAWFIRYAIRNIINNDEWVLPDLIDYTYSIGIQIFYYCAYVITYEGIYSLQKWKQTHLDKEALRKANLQNQLDSLKSQINPHFLFNSLNSLSALITENPAQAELFVDEISSVYRYLLRNNEDKLTPLRDEMDFIESYVHLLKTRYGSGLQIQISVDSLYDDYLLPPLTLQILIENAVKHNMILAESPLEIDIYIENEELVVQNNLQRKTTKVDSNQIGLANIMAKYTLLGNYQILVQDDEDYFTVRLPLLRAQQLTTT